MQFHRYVHVCMCVSACVHMCVCACVHAEENSIPYCFESLTLAEGQVAKLVCVCTCVCVCVCVCVCGGGGGVKDC